jgi:hypothetical protein
LLRRRELARRALVGKGAALDPAAAIKKRRCLRLRFALWFAITGSITEFT